MFPCLRGRTRFLTMEKIHIILRYLFKPEIIMLGKNFPALFSQKRCTKILSVLNSKPTSHFGLHLIPSNFMNMLFSIMTSYFLIISLKEVPIVLSASLHIVLGF